MKTRLIMFFSLSIFICSCNKNLYKEYSFREKGIRKLSFYFINDTLGYFEVKYLCSNQSVNIQQKFVYKKINENQISIKGIESHAQPLIYVPIEKLSNCFEFNDTNNIERIPVIKDENITIYKRKIYWQKIEKEKVVSAYTFYGNVSNVLLLKQ